jgi:hypothetical protein
MAWEKFQRPFSREAWPRQDWQMAEKGSRTASERPQDVKNSFQRGRS